MLKNNLRALDTKPTRIKRIINAVYETILVFDESLTERDKRAIMNTTSSAFYKTLVRPTVKRYMRGHRVSKGEIERAVRFIEKRVDLDKYWHIFAHAGVNNSEEEWLVNRF